MKSRKIIKYIIVLGVFLVAFAAVVGFAFANRSTRLPVDYQSAEAGNNPTEAIADVQIPLAASQTVKTAKSAASVAAMTQEKEPVVRVDNPEMASTTPTPTPEPAKESPATPTLEPEAPEKLPSETTNVPKGPATEEPTPTPFVPTPTPEEPTPAPSEPTTSPTPAKAQKPADITDTVTMAKYLYDAATEFWAVEKDFCGTTTRPVSTRVASSIGAGTAVDCPGGDTVRIDKNGVAHDSYAIADHFRDYVDMPDLQYFKIYLSDKDYNVNPYGAREDVTGTYYQYGSVRTTYLPEDEEDED